MYIRPSMVLSRVLLPFGTLFLQVTLTPTIIVSTKLQAGISESASATAAPGTVLHSLLTQRRYLSTSRDSHVSHLLDKLLEVEEELLQVFFIWVLGEIN